ncbi:hypothetical protein [Niabella sp.]|uniref:hypothetical protein n=1 Tax=Niabella sp. TaxID=1962976 RepID=UPI0026361601|nr:hypothetical protein [Niabella sp.]
MDTFPEVYRNDLSVVIVEVPGGYHVYGPQRQLGERKSVGDAAPEGSNVMNVDRIFENQM